MRKTLLLTALALTTAGLTFAAATPMTDFDGNSAEVKLAYGFNQAVTGQTGHVTGYSAALGAGLSDKIAVEYNYMHYNGKPSSSNINYFTGYYKVNDNINAYGSMARISSKDASPWGYQVGVVAHTPIMQNAQAFAKIGLGNKLNKALQLGVKYDIAPNIDISAYYEYDGIKLNNENGHASGLYTGVAMKF